MRPHFHVLLACVLLLAATRSAPGQCRLSSAQNGIGAIDRGRAIVSDYETNLPPHIHFYAKSGSGWQPGETFVIGDLQIGFFLPVGIDGDRAIAGSPESDGIAGRAYVFDRVGDHWVATQLVSATNGYADFFGSAVDVSGDVAIVGASHWGPDGNGDDLGRVHVFEFDGASWREVAQLMAYGDSIDVEGETIAVGEDRAYPGHVQIFRRMAGLWTWTDRLELLPPPPNGPRLGTSVALHGDRIAVGAALRMSTLAPGFVQVFRSTPGGWQPSQHIVPSNSFPGDQFGASVAWSGSTLLVGAPGWDAVGHGAVHRFEHDGTSFIEVGAFRSDPPGSGFGYHVAFQREDGILSGFPDVSFYRLGFAEQTLFCPTTPNSTGSPGSLSIEGCDSLSGQRLTLRASSLPSHVLGLFFFGPRTTQVPYGDGFRCVGTPLFRLPGGTTDGSGSLVHDVDFASGAAGHLTAGRTWHFQAYYRDPGSSGAQLNLTNAVSIGITP